MGLSQHTMETWRLWKRYTGRYGKGHRVDRVVENNFGVHAAEMTRDVEKK